MRWRVWGLGFRVWGLGVQKFKGSMGAKRFLIS